MFFLSWLLEIPAFERDRVFDYSDPLGTIGFFLAAVCQDFNVRTPGFPSFPESEFIMSISKECGPTLLYVAAMTRAVQLVI